MHLLLHRCIAKSVLRADLAPLAAPETNVSEVTKGYQSIQQFTLDIPCVSKNTFCRLVVEYISLFFFVYGSQYLQNKIHGCFQHISYTMHFPGVTKVHQRPKTVIFHILWVVLKCVLWPKLQLYLILLYWILITRLYSMTCIGVLTILYVQCISASISKHTMGYLLLCLY